MVSDALLPRMSAEHPVFFEAFLDAIAKPRSRDHKEAVGWHRGCYGEDFDPERINQLAAKLRIGDIAKRRAAGKAAFAKRQSTDKAAFSPRLQTGAASEGLNLEPGESFAHLVGKRSAHSALLLVEPGAPDRSYLIAKLEGSQLHVGGTLTLEEIAKIRTWISEGAKP